MEVGKLKASTKATARSADTWQAHSRENMIPTINSA